MNIKEITEGKVKNLAIDREFDRQNSPGPAPTPQATLKKQMNYNVVVNGKVWKDFPTEQKAMQVATSLHNKNPHLRISVMPK